MVSGLIICNSLSTESQRRHKEEREARTICLPTTDEAKIEQEKTDKIGWSVFWSDEEGQERFRTGSKAAPKKKIALTRT